MLQDFKACFRPQSGLVEVIHCLRKHLHQSIRIGNGEVLDPIARRGLSWLKQRLSGKILTREFYFDGRLFFHIIRKSLRSSFMQIVNG
jgi:hypothetical protein